MPRQTRLTDMNAYTNASKPDQPFTSPVALRRNSDGAAELSIGFAVASDAMRYLHPLTGCSAAWKRAPSSPPRLSVHIVVRGASAHGAPGRERRVSR